MTQEERESAWKKYLKEGFNSVIYSDEELAKMQEVLINKYFIYEKI